MLAIKQCAYFAFQFELVDHYGNEHFCPITMVRLFGLVSDDLDEGAQASETRPFAPETLDNDLETHSTEKPGDIEEKTSRSN